MELRSDAGAFACLLSFFRLTSFLIRSGSCRLNNTQHFYLPGRYTVVFFFLFEGEIFPHMRIAHTPAIAMPSSCLSSADVTLRLRVFTCFWQWQLSGCAPQKCKCCFIRRQGTWYHDSMNHSILHREISARSVASGHVHTLTTGISIFASLSPCLSEYEKACLSLSCAILVVIECP